MPVTIQPWSDGKFTSQKKSPPSEAGRGVAFLKLAGANAKAMAGVGRICKIRVLRSEKEAPGF